MAQRENSFPGCFSAAIALGLHNTRGTEVTRGRPRSTRIGFKRRKSPPPAKRESTVVLSEYSPLENDFWPRNVRCGMINVRLSGRRVQRGAARGAGSWG